MKIKEYTVQCILFFAILCFIALLSHRVYIRVDTTQQKTYTLSSYTKSILGMLDNTVTITWFTSYNADGYIPALQYVETFLHEYEICAPEYCTVIRKETESMQDKSLTQLGLAVRQVEQMQRNTRMLHNIYSGILCEYRGKTRVIPFLTDIYTLEADIARFIIEMDQDSRNRSDERFLYVALPPHRDNAPTDGDTYRYVLPWIEYAGFIPIILPQAFTELKPEIPLLVIGSNYFDAAMLTAVDTFLQRNGSAAFFISANEVDVRGNWSAQPKPLTGLFDILRRFGVEFHHDLLMDPVNFRLTMPTADKSSYTHINYPFWPQIFGTYREDMSILQHEQNTANTIPVFIPFGKNIQLFWPSSLTISAVRGRSLVPVLVSSPHAAVQHPPYTTDPYAKYSVADAKSSFCIAAASTGTGAGRIFTAADEYCLSTAIEYTNSDVNMDFMVNVLHWIAGQDSLLQIKQKQPAVLPFRYFADEQDFSRIVFFARVFVFLVIPLLAAGCGIAAFVYKKNYEIV